MSTHIPDTNIRPAKQPSVNALAVKRSDKLDTDRCKHVLRVVASYFGLPIDTLMAPTRGKQDVAFARQLAMYLANTHYQLSMPLIARTMGRDRSTIGFGIRRIEDLRDNERTDTIINCLELLLMNGDRHNHVSDSSARLSN
ncbi:MAG: helix-turn-helix domain-containing protein [Pseudomonadota bacterium]